MKLSQRLSEFQQNEEGQDLLEYALVLAAVLAAVVSGSQSIASVILAGMSSLSARIASTVA